MSDERCQATFDVDNTSVLLALTGPRGQLLGEVARQSHAEVNLRGNTVLLSGAAEDVAVARRFLVDAAELIRRGVDVAIGDVGPSVRELRQDADASLRGLVDETIDLSARRKPVVPKTTMQRRYVSLMRTHDLTFGIGPAGTGKTYLAMAMGVSALLKHTVKRIILTRPAVEAGEKLGFLPGDLADKVNPYLRPLYDALHDMLDFERVQALKEAGQIEVAPLAFMRGRTLNNSFIILDEAQNATSEQMRMFLTRLGFASRAVVTGDVTQTDLPSGARSGLAEAWDLLGGVEGVARCRFSDADVVRHPLVQRIVVAYEKNDAAREEQLAHRPASWRPRPGTAPPSKPPRTPSGEPRGLQPATPGPLRVDSGADEALAPGPSVLPPRA